MSNFDEYDDRSQLPPPSPPRDRTIGVWSFIKLMLLAVALMTVVSYTWVRMHNTFVVPWIEASREQELIVRNNTVNFNKKCVDPKVRASFDGFDNCLEHEAVIKAGHYYPTLQLYARKLDPCGHKGCMSIEVNAVSLMMMVVPVGFGFSTLILAVLLATLIVWLQRKLASSYELPSTMPIQVIAMPQIDRRSRSPARRAHAPASTSAPPLSALGTFMSYMQKPHNAEQLAYPPPLNASESNI